MKNLEGYGWTESEYLTISLKGLRESITKCLSQEAGVLITKSPSLITFEKC